MKECINKHAASIIFFVVLAFTLARSVNSEQKVDPERGVDFVVPVETRIFSENAILTVTLWNAKQLEINRNTNECMITYDMETETEEIDCPEGIEYEKPMPEEFSFPVREIVSSLKIRSNTIKTGERYRLQISGTSSDNCNTTSAEVESKAYSETIQLGQLSWSSTLMGCP